MYLNDGLRGYLQMIDAYVTGMNLFKQGVESTF